MDMELTREDVEIVKSKVSFLDILLLMCGIVSVTIGIVITSLITWSLVMVKIDNIYISFTYNRYL